MDRETSIDTTYTASGPLKVYTGPGECDTIAVVVNKHKCIGNHAMYLKNVHSSTL